MQDPWHVAMHWSNLHKTLTIPVLKLPFILKQRMDYHLLGHGTRSKQEHANAENWELLWNAIIHNKKQPMFPKKWTNIAGKDKRWSSVSFTFQDLIVDNLVGYNVKPQHGLRNACLQSLDFTRQDSWSLSAALIAEWQNTPKSSMQLVRETDSIRLWQFNWLVLCHHFA